MEDRQLLWWTINTDPTCIILAAPVPTRSYHSDKSAIDWTTLNFSAVAHIRSGKWITLNLINKTYIKNIRLQQSVRWSQLLYYKKISKICQSFYRVKPWNYVILRRIIKTVLRTPLLVCIIEFIHYYSVYSTCIPRQRRHAALPRTASAER